MFCLTPDAIKAMKEKFLSGELTPEKLNNAKTSDERRAMLSFLGDKTALKVNELIESKLLLKNQQKGLITAAKQLLGEKSPATKDMVSSIIKMKRYLHPEEAEKFMSDLAAKKLGTRVTAEEAEKIFNIADKANTAKTAIPEGSPNGSKERLDYGNALVSLKEYMGHVKRENNKIPLKDLITDPIEGFIKLSGVSKSLVANLNNHFFGRQGWRTLFDRPEIWTKNFMKSWNDMAKELKGIDAMSPIKAEIWSRENALNGLYSKHKVDIGLDTEEAFPEHLPGQIPLLGKLYKASESAFNGASLRMRADTFDALVKEAKENGVDVNDKDTNLGTLANSITARGNVNLPGKIGRVFNAAMFSPKYLKSQLDLIGAIPDYLINKTPLGKGTAEGEFARAKHAQNAIKIIAGISSMLALAKLLDPDSVDLDPRSSRSGKIWVGKDHEIGFDITAGIGSLFTLAARLTPTIHNGEFGLWSQSQSGRWTNNMPGSHSKHSPAELLAGFFEQRASPLMGYIIQTYLDHKGYDKETPGGKALKLISPMNAQAITDLNKDTEDIDAAIYTLAVGAGLLGTHVSPDYQHRKEE